VNEQPKNRRRHSLAQRAERVITPISRRSLLRGLSAGALCLSLPIWRRLEAEAQDAATPLRFFAFFTPNGTLEREFFPSQAADPTSSAILAPFAPFASRIHVLKGVHMDSMIGDGKPGGPHMKGPAAMLTGGWLLEGSFSGAGGPAGYANRISLDQSLANHIGTQTAFRSLEFGVDMRGQEPLKYISYRGPNQPNPAVDNPWVMYERIFANFVPSEDAESVRRRRESQTVLDYTKNELSKLKSRLPGEDRPRLEAHLEHLRTIERKLDAVRRECALPASLGNPIDVKADDNYPKIGKLQMELMFHAQACDLTRVSTFMWSNADSWQRMPWLGIDDEHHGLSHNDADPTVRAKLLKINVWYSQQIASFLAMLDTIPDGNGTMLDHSVVLCGNEIGQGNHTHRNIPWLVAGSGGGRLVTGRMTDYGGRPHNDLLLTLLHAFGMTSETSYGAKEHCTGVLPGLLT
jgi:hypothetical protein